MGKAEQMAEIMPKVQEILHILNPEQNWKIEFVRFRPETRERFTEWNIEYHRLREYNDYIAVWDRDGRLLYTVNVSGDSTKWIIREIFTVVGDKF